MRVAVVAPVDEVVPPPAYGGTELVVHFLAEQLVRMGHDVMLLAAGGSRSSARVVTTAASALRHTRASLEVSPTRRKQQLATEIVDIINSERPDIVHNHFRHLLPSIDRVAPPVVTTVHYPLDHGLRARQYLDRPQANYVSISYSQQRAAPELNFVGNVYHGIPVQHYPFQRRAGKYLAFVGRIAPEKGVDIAIDVARQARVPLKIAAKVEPEYDRYFRVKIQPVVDGSDVEYLGELGQDDKRRLLHGARALLAPVQWSEPFGLALLEAMSCGTPVIALRNGAVPEIVRHGRTGFVEDDTPGLVSAVARLATISRTECRRHADERFDATRMAADYERIYRAILS